MTGENRLNVVHDGQHADLLAGGQLVMDEVHGPKLIGLEVREDRRAAPARLQPGVLRSCRPNSLIKPVDAVDSQMISPSRRRRTWTRR